MSNFLKKFTPLILLVLLQSTSSQAMCISTAKIEAMKMQTSKKIEKYRKQLLEENRSQATSDKNNNIQTLEKIEKHEAILKMFRALEKDRSANRTKKGCKSCCKNCKKGKECEGKKK